MNDECTSENKYVERIAELEQLCSKAIPFIKSASHAAEARHDNPDGEYYMELSQYEIYKEGEKLIAAIDAARCADD